MICGWADTLHLMRLSGMLMTSLYTATSKTEAEQLLEAIRERLQGFGLELHPEKTKLVYCKNDLRKEEHEHNSFTFLSYSFSHAAS